MGFDRLPPSARRDGLGFADRAIAGDRHEALELARDHEALVNRLAIVAEAGCDVHRVTEKGELALGVTAFAEPRNQRLALC